MSNAEWLGERDGETRKGHQSSLFDKSKKQQKKSEIISSKCAESRDIKNNYDNEFTQKNETAITEKFFLRKQNCKMYQILKFSNLKK